MTGYGNGNSRTDDFSVKTELQTYNHRFLDIKVRLPGEYQSLESYIVKKISARLSRGRVNVFIAFQRSGDRYRVIINEALAKKYWQALNRMQRVIKAKAGIGPEVLIGLPGVLEATSVTPSIREFKKQVGLSLERALEKLLAMRKKEGAALSADLSKHVNLLTVCVARVQKQLDKKESQRLARQERKDAGKAGEQTSAGINVEEELSRLENHIKQFKGYLISKKPVGKTLEFLCQEMLREVTTLGDKAADSVVSGQIVMMKSELESLREQARNVE